MQYQTGREIREKGLGRNQRKAGVSGSVVYSLQALEFTL